MGQYVLLPMILPFFMQSIEYRNGSRQLSVCREPAE